MQIEREDQVSYPKFNITRNYLATQLFVPQKPREGIIWTNLNISILPDYLQYIKQSLQKQEKLILSQYHLQTYLIEIAMKPHPRSNFDECTEKIIQHIRSHQKYWAKKTTEDDGKLKVADEEFRKDLGKIRQKTETLQQGYESHPFQFARQELIPDDFKIIGKQNQYISTKYPINVTVVPYIIDFALKDSEGKCEQWHIQMYQEIIEQLLIGIKNKNRTNYQYGYNFQRNYYMSDEQIQIKAMGEKIIREFCQFLDELQVVETKSLNNGRQYALTINLIRIIKLIDEKLNNSSKQFKSQVEIKTPEEKMEVVVDNNIKEIEEEPLQKIGYEQNEKQKPNGTNLRHQQNGLKQKQQQVLKSDIGNRIFTFFEATSVVNDLLDSEKLNPHKQFVFVSKQIMMQEKQSQKQWYGFFDDVMQINNVAVAYKQMLQHPENAQQFKYRVHGIEIPWTEEEYKYFLIKFLQFFNVPTNNRKIALAMSTMPSVQQQTQKSSKKVIQPSHVKHVKGIYCRNMSKRIDVGEIGGGKKGYLDSKLQFLKRDIQNFNMRWFKRERNTQKGKGKQKNNRKKRIRRRRYEDDGDELDSDY